MRGVSGAPESVAQSHLVRDVFSNPFRPVSLGGTLPARGGPSLLASRPAPRAALADPGQAR